MYNKLYILRLLTLSFLVIFQIKAQTIDPSIVNVTAKEVVEKYLTSPIPVNKSIATNNPQPLRWPSKRAVHYDIRLSQTSDFSQNIITAENLPYAFFTAKKVMNTGKWFWQYRKHQGTWSKVNNFVINNATSVKLYPPIKDILAKIPKAHPRLLVMKDQLLALRIRAKDMQESKDILTEADQLLTLSPPEEKSTEQHAQGKTPHQNEKLALKHSKWAGIYAGNSMSLLSKAYILSGSNKYAIAAKEWATAISHWDPNGQSSISNFGDSSIMLGLTTAWDSAPHLYSSDEKSQLLASVSTRANNFYNHWRGSIERRAAHNHTWQYNIHRLLLTAMTLKDEIPEAKKWLTYTYELWLQRSPILGNKDGAWSNGRAYFLLNAETLFDTAQLLTSLTGFNYLDNDWFKNNSKWLIHALLPKSTSDGFNNGASNVLKPTLRDAAYAELLAHSMDDQRAAWYADEILKSLEQPLSADKHLRWHRIQRLSSMHRPPPIKAIDLANATTFPNVGLAYMHSDISTPEKNLMLAMRSGLFGGMGHMHSNQNSFNLAWGGERLFWGTGYRPVMGDPHYLAWHSATQSKNSILIDGHSQATNKSSAYGWLPRFLHSEKLSYVAGDASNAYYDDKYGMLKFRRHLVMLRPDIIVVYDDLVADRSVQWSWLLHSNNEMVLDETKQTIIGENSLATAKVSLFSQQPLAFSVTNKSTPEVINWLENKDEHGNIRNYKDQWHFTAKNPDKSKVMRYLSIIKLTEKSNNTITETIRFDKSSSTAQIGDWFIQANLDEGSEAQLKVWDSKQSVVFTTNGEITLNDEQYTGKMKGNAKLIIMQDEQLIMYETADVLPDMIKNAQLRENHL